MDRPIVTLRAGTPMLTNVDWDIDWREQSAGTTVAGRRNIAIGLLPRWVGTPGVFARNELIGVWRAHRLAARGQSGLFRMPLIDPAVFSPEDYVLTFGDGVTFSDGAGFETEWAVRTDTGADRGDTTIRVVLASANGPIKQGQILSYADWPFAVVEINGDELRIEPPLRVDIPAGELIRLDGRGIFEMVNPMEGRLSYDANQWTTGNFQLQEWLR